MCFKALLIDFTHCKLNYFFPKVMLGGVGDIVMETGVCPHSFSSKQRTKNRKEVCPNSIFEYFGQRTITPSAVSHSFWQKSLYGFKNTTFIKR